MWEHQSTFPVRGMFYTVLYSNIVDHVQSSSGRPQQMNLGAMDSPHWTHTEIIFNTADVLASHIDTFFSFKHCLFFLRPKITGPPLR